MPPYLCAKPLSRFPPTNVCQCCGEGVITEAVNVNKVILLITHTLTPVVHHLACLVQAFLLIITQCACVSVSLFKNVCDSPSFSLILSGTDSWHVCQAEPTTRFKCLTKAAQEILASLKLTYTHTWTPSWTRWVMLCAHHNTNNLSQQEKGPAIY